MVKCCIILTTTNDEALATFIAMELLSMQLAACVQIDKIESLYIWEGEIKKSPEYRVLIKTIVSSYKDVELYLQKHHNYDTPEIMMLEIDHIEERYLGWISKTNREI